MPHSRLERSNASQSETGIKKNVGRPRTEPADVFASPRCSMDRASPAHDARGIIEMSSQRRERLTGTDSSNPFSYTVDSYKHTNPITATDRMPPTSSSGNGGTSVGSGETQTTPEKCSTVSHRRLDRTSGRPQAGSAEPPGSRPGVSLHTAPVSSSVGSSFGRTSVALSISSAICSC